MEKMAKINYSELTSEKINDFISTFSLKPLSRGYANTLGTALRRTLLSSITSCASFAVKINGVNHEFDILKGVREDIVELLGNIRQIRFIYNEELFEAPGSFVKIYFHTNKDGLITAGDIDFPSGLEIINPDLEIAHLFEGELEFELYIRAGRGFIDFEDNKRIIREYENRFESKIKSGQVLAIDSDFSPIKKISYEVEELNSASLVIEEELKLRIETDGTVTAKDALSHASQILIAHFQVIGNIENIEEINLFDSVKIEKENNEMRSMDIEKLELSVRSINALHRAGYRKVEDLLSLTEEEFSNIKNLGKKSVDDIMNKILLFKENLNKGEE
ncbi:DNA-directed RNA polymerase subunit alpha [Mycoplasma phocoenae]|uniref:DNA-directed RNA polymerase subunit alpha n=1 Tax=Mycoplasma phocoenae TaxID=754517 RepID=A0A858U3W7_9MOLU|nr:DNA-directed RNA polymerase subunit alpha [Mycoplasma phocoenae]QJG67122.1 DNA-directed RNA polymerase subunit alpha [Mycoplasma phocoenae]